MRDPAGNFVKMSERARRMPRYVRVAETQELSRDKRLAITAKHLHGAFALGVRHRVFVHPVRSVRGKLAP